MTVVEPQVRDGRRAGYPVVRRRWRWLPVDRVAAAVTLAILVCLVLLPVGALLLGSFWSAPPHQQGGHPTLSNYTGAFSHPLVARTLVNTLIFAVGTTAIATCAGTALAWIVTRTNTAGRRVFEFMTLVLFLVPSILAVIAWSMLLGSRRGVINQLLMNAFGLDEPPLEIYSLWGMVWVQGLYLAPLAFLIIAGAFKTIDQGLEESARMSGSGPFQGLWRVTLPVSRPAILSAALLVFIISIESFEVPQLLGARSRTYTFTSLIFLQLRGLFPPDYGLATALASALLVIALVALVVYRRATAQSARYVTVKGKGYRAGIVDIGRWRWVTFTFCCLFFGITVLLPVGVLFVGSLLRYYGRFDAEVFSRMSWHNYEVLLDHPTLLEGARNSLFLAVVSGAVCILLAAAVGFIVTRTKLRGRGALEGIAMLPLVYPATVLAVGLLWAYIVLPVPVYGTIVILGLAYVTRYIPIGLRSVTGGLVQIDRELEEASKMSGANTMTTVRRIVLPLLTPSLLAGWLILFMILVRELSMSILLASTGTPVLSVVLFDYYQDAEFGLLSAAALVILVAILAIVFVAQRIFKISISQL